MARKHLENKHIIKPPKKRRGRHTKRVNKSKTYKKYAGQGRVQFMKKVKCIFKFYAGFCALLKQCKCVKINEDDFNPFRQKL